MSDKPTIFEIFADVKRAVGPVGKDSRNTVQNFNFRGIDAVVNAVAPALDRLGVITAPHLDKMTYGTVEAGKARTPMAHVQVEVTYNFYGPAGDSFAVKVPGEAMDSGDKATPKAMSVAYRIALLQVLNLPTDEADPDSQSYERSGRGADNGQQPRSGQQGQVSRPQATARPAGPQGAPEADPDAQKYADTASQARTVGDLEKIHKEAVAAGKIGASVRASASGTVGKLAVYLDWRRKQLADLDKAWKELDSAQAAARIDVTELEVIVKRETGVDADSATASQLRQVAAKLLERAA